MKNERELSPTKHRKILAVPRTCAALAKDCAGQEHILRILENRRVSTLGFRERRGWAAVPPGVRGQWRSDNCGSRMACARELGQSTGARDNRQGANGEVIRTTYSERLCRTLAREALRILR